MASMIFAIGRKGRGPMSAEDSDGGSQESGSTVDRAQRALAKALDTSVDSYDPDRAAKAIRVMIQSMLEERESTEEE